MEPLIEEKKIKIRSSKNNDVIKKIRMLTYNPNIRVSLKNVENTLNGLNKSLHKNHKHGQLRVVIYRDEGGFSSEHFEICNHDLSIKKYFIEYIGELCPFNDENINEKSINKFQVWFVEQNLHN
jgi:hypothetical protein